MDMVGFNAPDLPRFRTILLFGPPGCGKGTIGKALGATHHLHLSTGDVFRGIDPESPNGQLIHPYIKRGHLVPDPITMKIWAAYMVGLMSTNRFVPSKQTVILDGLPRTKQQAIILNEIADVIAVICLRVKNQGVLVERLTNRAKLEGRPDDAKVNIIEERLRVYEKQTLEVLSVLPAEKVFEINAEQKPFQVLRDVLVAISPLV